MDCSLNVTVVNQLLRSDDVTVTLQWPREPGAVYHVSVSEVSHTELNSMRHIFAINLTISYNIQYNVSIVSSLCGVTTTKALKYGRYENDSEIILHVPGDSRLPNLMYITGMKKLGRACMHMRLDNIIIIIYYNYFFVVTCDQPTQLLNHPVVVVSRSQDSPPLIEGQVITYTCSHGFVRTGPNASVCTGNREWEPDPGEVDCIGDN